MTDNVLVEFVSNARKKKQSRAKWFDRCIKNETGKPVPNLANALIGVTGDFLSPYEVLSPWYLARLLL